MLWKCDGTLHSPLRGKLNETISLEYSYEKNLNMYVSYDLLTSLLDILFDIYESWCHKKTYKQKWITALCGLVPNENKSNTHQQANG